MPKSEFDEQLPVSGGLVQVSGTVDPDTVASAKKSGADVDVHWVLAQGRLVAHGRARAKGERFTEGDQGGPQPWKPGRAQVSGVTVTVVISSRPAQIEAIQWHQEVTLEVD
jgi:hypothetical protein